MNQTESNRLRFLSPASFNTDGLLDYQAPASESVAISLLQNGVSVDFSDMGSGKTYTAGGALREVVSRIGCRFVIICPRAVKKAWKDACNHFKIKPFAITNYEKLTRGSTPFVKYKRIKGTAEYDYVWKLPQGTIIVCDEVHKCKGVNTLNGQLLRSAKRSGYRLHCMSATAATNPLECYSLGFVLGLHNGQMREFREWCKDHGAEYTGRFAAMTYDYKDAKAQAAMRKLHREIFVERNFGVRIRISDLGDKFPDSKISADAIDFGDQTGKINKAYEIMERELAKLDEHTQDYQAHIFSIILATRQRVELLKLPTITEMVKDAIENGKYPVVFLNFKDSILALEKKLGKRIEVAKITGGQSDDERNTEIERFQQGLANVCIASVSAGGVGVSLHDTSGERPRISIIAPTYSAIQMTQTFGRVRRQGGGFTIQSVVYADGTIENRICDKVRAKLKNINLLNDGDLHDGITDRYAHQLRF